MKSKGVWTHLDSSAVTPQPLATATSASGAPGTVPVAQGSVTTAGTSPIDPAMVKYKEDLDKWNKDEALPLDLLTQCICCSHVG